MASLGVLEVEALSPDHLERLLDRGAVTPIRAVVSEADVAGGIDDDGCRAVDLFGVSEKSLFLDLASVLISSQVAHRTQEA